MTRSAQRKAQREPQRKPQEERLQRKSRTLDPFHVDQDKIPKGWSYEWKRVTYNGKEDRGHQINLMENHWRPVPSSRHPELSQEEGDQPIMKDGQMLMERPQYLTDEAHEEDFNRSQQQIGNQLQRLEQIDGLGKGMEQTPSQIERSYERVTPQQRGQEVGDEE